MAVCLVPCLVMFLIVLVTEVTLLENGLARTPPMGWMSWGYYMCGDKCEKDPDKCLDEKLIMSVADAFYTQGYLEAGYEYIIIDDCWSERKRVNNKLVPDRKRFPRGMKFLADYIHERGLKFGMYINIAKYTCMQYPGSRGHFEEDVQMFAEWEVDYIKVDGCFVEERYLDQAYVKLGQYLNKTGRPMVYSCSWPYYKRYIHKHEFDFSKAVSTCNLWRNFHDIFLNWGSVRGIIEHFEQEALKLQKYHGPGHWNDPDMLIVGTNSLTESQSRVHMCVWALLSAPLLLSCDVRAVGARERGLLTNMDLVAVAQDPGGRMATPHKLSKHLTLWVKPHLPMKGDTFYSFSFALVNLGGAPRAVSLAPAEYGLDPYVELYSVLNIFSGEYIKNITYNDTIKVTVPPEDVIMYTMYPI